MHSHNILYPTIPLQKYTSTFNSRNRNLPLYVTTFVLFSPYLPPIAGLARFRIDHFLIYFLLGQSLLFALRRGKYNVSSSPVINLSLGAYALFLFWLLVVTFLGPSNALADASIGEWLAGYDAYLRPFALLVIFTRIQLNVSNFNKFVYWNLIFVILLVAIAVLQMLPITAPMINPWVARYFTNDIVALSSGQSWFLNALLNNGRTASLLGQVGTFAMYNLYIICLLTAYWITPKVIQKKTLVYLSMFAAMLGGILSTSKVFTGGILILGLCLILSKKIRIRLLSLTAVFQALICMGGVALIAYIFFPMQTQAFSQRIDISQISLESYTAGRFISTSDYEAKLARTGAFYIVKKYPLTGVGSRIVHRTTDSFIFGVLMMGGIVAAILYIIFLIGIIIGLLNLVRHHNEEIIRSLAWVMICATFIFFVISIGFHTFIQDRAGDVYWILVGTLLGQPLNNYKRKLI